MQSQLTLSHPAADRQLPLPFWPSARGFTIEDLPPEWTHWLLYEEGLEDCDVLERAVTHYQAGDWPLRCLNLDCGVIVNGREWHRRYIATVERAAAPFVEEFIDCYRPGEGDRTGCVADWMNWCRQTCRGGWLVDCHHISAKLRHVYVAFELEIDANRFDAASEEELPDAA
jgi:hypothetical protein